MKFRTLILAITCCALLSASCAAYAADRGPSTPEERKQVMDSISDYLSNPLGANAVKDRESVLMWVIQVPDIHVSICSFFDKQTKHNKTEDAEIFAGMTMAQTAYAIENRDKQPDALAQYLAGVNGSLRVYEAFLKANEKNRIAYFDGLLQQREAGTLTQYVKDRVDKSCKN